MVEFTLISSRVNVEERVKKRVLLPFFDQNLLIWKYFLEKLRGKLSESITGTG